MKVKAMDESNSFDTPNRRSEPNVFKPSLRSKTMHCSTNFKKSDPKKLLRHKSVEERSLGLYANTFASIPTFKTPPSTMKNKVPFNPFNVGLRERLEYSTVSPNVFSSVLSPSQDSEEIRWTIEDLSSIKPAPIEENMEPLSEPDDPQVQEAIEKYFSETHMVPSPFDAPRNWVSRDFAGTPLLSKLCKHAVASTPRGDSDKSVRTRDVLVQTALSLPPTLPEHVEAVLRPFFNTVDDGEMEESNLNISSMRRKLFFHKDDEQLSPVKHNNETNSQKTEQFTPSNTSQSRHYTPMASSEDLLQPGDPPISPISMERSSINVSKTRVRLEFLDSCDNQFNKELPDDQDRNVDVVLDVNSLIDEPMMVSIIDVTKFHGMKKQRSSSDDNVTKPVTSTMCNDGSASNPSHFEDNGYYTNEDMSWRQSLPIINDRDKNVSSLAISILAASTPTKQQVDEIF